MYRITRKQFPLTVLNGQTTITSTDVLNVNGLLRGVLINAPDLTASHTYSIVIKDLDGQTIFSKSGVTENQISSYFIDANNYPLMVALDGNEKITITTSGSEGANRLFTVTLLVDRGM